MHEKMSYDTFFTMKRLIDRSRTVDEVLRWVTQNPGKISYNHYPIALLKIGQILQQGGTGSCLNGESHYSQVSEQMDFQTLCNSIIKDSSKFDHFSIVNCLYAVAALGLPSDLQIVQVLEEECRNRFSHFNQKDISMVFSSVMKLHPSAQQHPLVDSCLSSLERNIEKEHHPQTLFLLLSYYKLKSQTLQSDAYTPEQLVNNRKILRLVKHTLASVINVRDHEMALLDEMLATCAREASNKSLELIFSSPLFHENRQEKFISSLAEELPKKVDSITPFTMALIAKYIARHRLRETKLLDAIAEFLVKKGEYLDSKVIQKLVFPFSRMSYRPSNETKFFEVLESVLELKAMNSPLASVNIIMSMFQLGHFPRSVLEHVFSTTFINNVMNSPYALIVRRYLSLLDTAVELEYRDYKGLRLEDHYKVMMFDHALTADEANRKYSYKGLVAEALRQLVGEQCYKQDEVLSPGYSTDFLLLVSESGTVLHINNTVSGKGNGIPLCCSVPNSLPKLAENTSGDVHTSVASLTSDFKKFSPFSNENFGAEGQEKGGEEKLEVNFLSHRHSSSGTVGLGNTGAPLSNASVDYNPYYSSSDYYSTLAKDHSLESQESSTLSSPSDCLTQTANATECSPVMTSASLFHFPIRKILSEDPKGAGRPQTVVQDHSLFNCEKPVHSFYSRTPYSEDELEKRVIEQADASNPTSPTKVSSPCQKSSTQKEDSKCNEKIRKVVMSVNDKWHYCHNSDILVGSRAMRDRHLRLMGYTILQLPFHELEKLNGIEDVKHYLCQKLMELQL